MIRRLLPAAFLLALAFALPAAAFEPVDDFENGYFNEPAWSYEEHVFPIPASDGHAMHITRKIVLDSDGEYTVATNTTGTPFSDRALYAYAGSTSTVRVEWEWGFPRDLTGLGTVDRIEVVVGSSPPNGQITAILTDSGGGEGVTIPTTGGYEILYYYFDDWSSVDPTNAETLGFRFDGSGQGFEAYTVSEIRFRSSGSLNIDFVGDFVATQIPPIPSSPLRYRAYDLFSNPLYQVDIVFQDAIAGGPVEVLANWEARPGATGEWGATEFRWNEFGQFLDTTFELSFDLASIGPLSPEILYYPPDPILDDPTGFRLDFPLRLTDGGAVAGHSNVMLLFDVDATQGAEFTSAVVTPRLNAQGTPTGFDLTFDYVGTVGVEVYEPLFYATWISDWDPAEPTDAPAIAAVREPNLRLVARPSVTRGATEIRANRPFEGEPRISVYDAGGRRLRSLRAVAGSRSTRWDGADDSGRPLPAGVYFVRLDDRAGTAATRVTRLR